MSYVNNLSIIKRLTLLKSLVKNLSIIKIFTLEIIGNQEKQKNIRSIYGLGHFGLIGYRRCFSNELFCLFSLRFSCMEYSPFRIMIQY